MFSAVPSPLQVILFVLVKEAEKRLSKFVGYRGKSRERKIKKITDSEEPQLNFREL